MNQVTGHTIKAVDSQSTHRSPPINQFNVKRMTDADYVARVKAKCTVTETGCWECAGFQHKLRGVKNPNTKGYVTVGYRGKALKAHRLMYTLLIGPIPPGLEVCHECDNPPCCNPDHLFLGTGSENAIDRVAKKRDRNRGRDVCIHGHELTGDNVRIRPTLRGFRRQCITCNKAQHKTPSYLAWRREYQRNRRAAKRAERLRTDETNLTGENRG